MPYDSSLDEVLFSESAEFENSRITVSIYSYNKGTAKLQVSRENADADGYKFAKLGRLTKDEAEQVIPLMQKALEHM